MPQSYNPVTTRKNCTMLTGYLPANQALTRVNIAARADLTPQIVWLDLVNPTADERAWIKDAYGQELQRMEELGEIEASARFYRDEFGLHINQYYLQVDERGVRKDRKSTRLNSSHVSESRMPSSA